MVNILSCGNGAFLILLLLQIPQQYESSASASSSFTTKTPENGPSDAATGIEMLLGDLLNKERGRLTSIVSLSLYLLLYFFESRLEVEKRGFY